jgi:hypothetical protein
MQYIRLGTSRLQITRFVLGCMGFGKPGTGRAGALDGDAADPVFAGSDHGIDITGETEPVQRFRQLISTMATVVHSV